MARLVTLPGMDGSRILPAIWKDLMAERMEALADVPLSRSRPCSPTRAMWWSASARASNVYSPEAQRRQLRAWLSDWLALSIVGAGFAIVSGPGAETVLERDGLRIAPFRWIEDLASGARTSEEWQTLALSDRGDHSRRLRIA